MPLQRTHALFTEDKTTICRTPSWSLPAGGLWANRIGNRDASIKVGSAASSGDAGGRHTKCKISAAEVPIYKFSSVKC